MITFPQNKRGRKTKEDSDLYQTQVQEFCDAILEINSSLDFKVSSRGWCYQLEEYGLNKGDFDTAQILINNCRRNGLLPLDICVEDVTRSAEGIKELHNPDIEEYARDWVHYIRHNVAGYYRPYSFTEYQDNYIELVVEKIDLKGIFAPICEEYMIPYWNGKGWSDMNSRARMMKRFQYWENEGKQCVLLYCGDHDPGGLHISDFIRDNLNDLKDAVGWSPDNLIIDRFGLNYDFIIENDLTWIENLATGSGGEIAIVKPDGSFGPGKTKNGKRHPDFDKDYVQNYLREVGVRKVEANALVTRVDAGRELFEDTVRKYINDEGIEQYQNETKEARRLLQDKITELLNS